jgi:hypothetical protein
VREIRPLRAMWRGQRIGRTYGTIAPVLDPTGVQVLVLVNGGRSAWGPPGRMTAV